MRQILVKGNALLRALSGNQIEFEAKEFKAGGQSIGPSVQIFRCPFALDIISGGDLRLRFELPRNLAERGAILHGAYWEDGEVSMAVSASVGLGLPLANSDVLLVGRIYETARFRQVVEELPKKKRRPHS